MHQTYFARIKGVLHGIKFQGMATKPVYVPGRFRTDNPDVQEYIENHPQYGKKFALEVSRFQSKAVGEVEVIPEKVARLTPEVPEVDDTMVAPTTEDEPVAESPVETEQLWEDPETGRTYKTKAALKAAITMREKAAKDNA